jgi:hypothetical protein
MRKGGPGIRSDEDGDQAGGDLSLRCLDASEPMSIENHTLLTGRQSARREMVRRGGWYAVE